MEATNKINEKVTYSVIWKSLGNHDMINVGQFDTLADAQMSYKQVLADNSHREVNVEPHCDYSDCYRLTIEEWHIFDDDMETYVNDCVESQNIYDIC